MPFARNSAMEPRDEPRLGRPSLNREQNDVSHAVQYFFVRRTKRRKRAAQPDVFRIRKIVRAESHFRGKRQDSSVAWVNDEVLKHRCLVKTLEDVRL